MCVHCSIVHSMLAKREECSDNSHVIHSFGACTKKAETLASLECRENLLTSEYAAIGAAVSFVIVVHFIC